MKNFRIKEVKNARVSFVGVKSSLFYPQVSTFFGLLFRNIRPSEMPGDKYKGNVIRFTNDSNAYNFIREYRDAKGIKPAPRKAEKQKKQSRVVYHKVNW